MSKFPLCEGYDYAIENDPRVKALVKALKLARRWISDEDPNWPIPKKIDKALNAFEKGEE